MTGALKPALAQDLDRLAAIHVGQADIDDQQIDHTAARRLDALCRGIFLQNREFLVKRQLFDQHFAQVVVVIDQKNCSCTH